MHADSNHPPSVLKQIPKSISKRISNNSSSKAIFEESSIIYNEALRKSGYTEKLTYCPDEVNESENGRKKNRSRKITWFNPPYSKDVDTNVAKIILGLVSKHFPHNHPYRKIFNKNNIKVSYGCLPNMKSTIATHNKMVTKEINESERTCNCPGNVRDKCPLDGQCLASKVAYNAEVSTIGDNNPNRDYIGTSKGPIKKRIAVHKKSFSDKTYNPTSLSKYIWSLKEKGIAYRIKWSILRRTGGYNSVSKSCSLCLTEKLLIASYPNKKTLINERNELVTKCRHDQDVILERQK